jgi:hypothetical protein
MQAEGMVIAGLAGWRLIVESGNADVARSRQRNLINEPKSTDLLITLSPIQITDAPTRDYPDMERDSAYRRSARPP